MSQYIPYVMTLRQGSPTTAEIRALEDGLGVFALRVAAIHQAVGWPVRVLGRVTHGGHGRPRVGAAVVPSPTGTNSDSL
jgi:hypothetical protein